MHVRVVKAGREHSTFETHHARRGPDEALRAGLRADEHDPAAAHRDRFGSRLSGVRRVDRAAAEEQIHRLGRTMRARARREQETDEDDSPHSGHFGDATGSRLLTSAYATAGSGVGSGDAAP